MVGELRKERLRPFGAIGLDDLRDLRVEPPVSLHAKEAADRLEVARRPRRDLVAERARLLDAVDAVDAAVQVDGLADFAPEVLPGLLDELAPTAVPPPGTTAPDNVLEVVGEQQRTPPPPRERRGFPVLVQKLARRLGELAVHRLRGVVRTVAVGVEADGELEVEPILFDDLEEHVQELASAAAARPGVEGEAVYSAAPGARDLQPRTRLQVRGRPLRHQPHVEELTARRVVEVLRIAQSLPRICLAVERLVRPRGQTAHVVREDETRLLIRRLGLSRRRQGETADGENRRPKQPPHSLDLESPHASCELPNDDGKTLLEQRHLSVLHGHRPPRVRLSVDAHIPVRQGVRRC